MTSPETITATKMIVSIETDKKYAGCHFAQIATTNASPCLARHLSTRYAAFAAAVAARLCYEMSFVQASCITLLRNANTHNAASDDDGRGDISPPTAPERHFQLAQTAPYLIDGHDTPLMRRGPLYRNTVKRLKI